MKNTLLKLLAVTVCAVGAIVDPMRAYAASLSERYLSDIKLCIGQDFNTSKAQFSAQGYKILSTDLNSSLDTPVYLGYKETTNPADAITGISMMNMSGNYSFAEYDALLERYKTSVNSTIADLVPAIEEYRSNYQKKTEAAVFCHDTLNKIVEDMDDNNARGMGDYLLECDLVKRDEIRDVFMKGNTQLVVVIQELLSLASDNGKDSWVTRLTNTTYDDLEEQYLDKYLHPSIAESKMDVDFSNGAEKLLGVWDTFYTMLQTVENDLRTDETGENGETCYDITEELAEAVEALPADATEEDKDAAESMTEAQLAVNVGFYEYLNSIEYDGVTLLDYFNRPADEIESYELYPMVASLSEAQIAQIDITGIYQLLNSSLGKDYLNAEGVKNLQSMLNGIETISMYDGVEQGLFGKSVALTSAATTHNNASEDKWQDALFSSAENDRRWSALGMYALATFGVFLTGEIFGVIGNSIEHTFITSVGTHTTKNVANRVILIYDELSPGGQSHFLYDRIVFNQSVSPAVNFCMLLRTVCFIVSLVMLVATVAKLIETIITSATSVDYEKIPHLIVDYNESTVDGEVQFKDLITYYAAEALDGREGDVNGFESHAGWLVLYYTKDSKAGKPIQSNLKIQNGSSTTPTGYENVCLFNKSLVVDLTNEAFTKEDDPLKGTFLFFKRGSSTYTGSTFTGGTAAIVGGISALAGIGLGAFFGSRSKRKKKQPA